VEFREFYSGRSDRRKCNKDGMFRRRGEGKKIRGKNDEKYLQYCCYVISGCISNGNGWFDACCK
jgi:hypothetical protein